MQQPRSHSTPAPWSCWILALGLCIYFTWSGQQFLAHNALNDADSSYFAYGGWLLLKGGELYRDFWDQKPPMIFYQNAALISLFGLNFKAWAWVHGLAFLGALGFVVSAVWKTCGLGWSLGLAVAIAYGFNLNNVLDYGNRTEFGLAWFEMLAFGCVGYGLRTRHGAWFFLAGSCAAVAGLYKPVGVASFLATLAWLVIWKLGNINIDIKNDINIKNNINIDIKKHINSTPLAAWACAGFFGAFCLCLWPLFCQGSLSEVWQATLIVPLSLSDGSGRSLGDAAAKLPPAFGPLWGLLWPWLLWPWVVYKANGQQRPLLIWLALWTVATLCGIVLQRHGHPHYYHPAVVPLLAGAFVTSAMGLSLWPNNTRRRIMFIVALVGLSLLFGRYFILRQWRQIGQLAAYEASYEPYVKLGHWLKLEIQQGSPLASNSLFKGSSEDWQRIKTAPTFYYWSMGYTLYLQAQLPCPGKVSPAIMCLGETGANLVLKDLDDLQQKGQIEFLVENPKTFPEYLTQPQMFAGPRAQQAVATYLRWRDRDFKKVAGDFGPFLVYRRNGTRSL